MLSYRLSSRLPSRFIIVILNYFRVALYQGGSKRMLPCDPIDGPRRGQCPELECPLAPAGCNYVVRHHRISEGACCPVCYPENSLGETCIILGGSRSHHIHDKSRCYAQKKASSSACGTILFTDMCCHNNKFYSPVPIPLSTIA